MPNSQLVHQNSPKPPNFLLTV